MLNVVTVFRFIKSKRKKNYLRRRLNISGGSFNYLYYHLEKNPFGSTELDDLKSMVEYLENNGKTEAAKELNELYLELNEAKERLGKKVTNLQNIMQSVEWWASCDTTEEGFDKEWNDYKLTSPR